MKKAIVFLVGILLTVTAFSQADSVYTVKASTDSVLSTLPDTAKLTYTKVYNDIKSGIGGLAAGLKVGATHVYEVLVKQQVVFSVVYLITDIIVLLSLIISFAFFAKAHKHTLDKNHIWYRDSVDDHEAIILPLVLGIISSIIFVSVLFINTSNMITGFINPEYGAIKDILEFVK